ncbi:hypothetical protein PDE_04350 [Penicillium oxalicum 114-2]|uniref:Uncharacterized protein n=1 Tax=Penicillium oxalicum (strain 114-2 / CGMCC 5302) TaxID=933388 RepID=S7ZL52_PENO1|nr:hypothetical protein PDE_04350 [Penicillium oxalicum 114-2]
MNVPVEKNRPEKESHCPVVSTQEFLHFSPVQLAQGRAITTRHVETFVDGRKDKHYHDLKLEPLAGPSNFASWMSGIEVLLAMHQVSFIVRGDFVPLGKTDPLYIWYDHAISVATGLIYAHVSQRVRENSCFMEAVFHRNPEAMLRSIRAHFGDDECATKGFEILEG